MSDEFSTFSTNTGSHHHNQSTLDGLRADLLKSLEGLGGDGVELPRQVDPGVPEDSLLRLLGRAGADEVDPARMQGGVNVGVNLGGDDDEVQLRQLHPVDDDERLQELRKAVVPDALPQGGVLFSPTQTLKAMEQLLKLAASVKGDLDKPSNATTKLMMDKVRGSLASTQGKLTDLLHAGKMSIRGADAYKGAELLGALYKDLDSLAQPGLHASGRAPEVVNRANALLSRVQMKTLL